LIGIGIEHLILWLKPLSAAPTLPRAVILGLFISLLATQGISWWRIMQFVDRTEITLGAGTSGYTTPVHYLLPVRDAVRDYDDVVVVSDGMRVLFDVEPARWAVMLRDSAACVRTLPSDGFALFPSGKFAAIVAPNAPQGEVADLYQSENVQIFPTRSQPYRVSFFDAAPVWSQAEIISIDPVRFANGVTLTGYAITADRIYLEWSLSAADEVDYQYFTHLLDADGQVLQQRDSSFWSGRHWCAGDRLISWQPNEVTDSAMVRIGFYTLGNEAGQYFPVDVLDALGNPAGNWVDITK
jgi:hypothetical protein